MTNREEFYRNCEKMDRYYEQGKKNGLDESHSRMYAIGRMHDEVDAFAIRWVDSKINEQTQLEANAGPIKNYDCEDDDLNCVLNGKGGTF